MGELPTRTLAPVPLDPYTVHLRKLSYSDVTLPPEAYYNVRFYSFYYYKLIGIFSRPIILGLAQKRYVAG